MNDKVKFEIWAATKYVGSKDRRIIEIDKDDLEGVPEEKWEDLVWDELGGQEEAFQMADFGIRRAED